MTLLQQAFSIALLHFLWQGLLLAVILLLVLHFLRNRAPGIRYATCCGALALLTLLPAITTGILYHRAPQPVPMFDRTQESVVPIPRVDGSSTRESGGSVTFAAVQTWVIRVWCGGVLVAFLRLRLGLNEVERLRQSGDRAGRAIESRVEALLERMGVTGRVEVLISSLASGPSMAGWLRPVILLPAAAVTGLSPDHLEAILAHEIAHIRRHDYLVNLLQIGAETLLFYHPAVWWISTRIRKEREYCCDDLAVQGCQSVICYARALANLEKLRLTAAAPALGSTDGSLLERIQRLLGEARGPAGPSRVSGILALSLVLVGIPLGVQTIRGQAHWKHPQADVGAAVFTAASGVRLLTQEPIDYSKSAQSAAQQGFVRIQVLVEPSGKVSRATVVPMSPSLAEEGAPGELQQAALTSVLKWRFARGPKMQLAMVDVLFQATPRSSDAFLQAGDFFFRSRLPGLALPRYKAGAERFPLRKLDFLKRQLNVYLMVENLVAAKATLTEILTEAPNDAEARSLRASFWLDQGLAVDQAADELQQAVGTNPHDLFAHYNLGRAHAIRHDTGHARKEFEEILRQRPDAIWAILAKSEIAILQGDYNAAIRYAEQLVGRPPFDLSALVLKATALRSLHRYEEAGRLIDQVLMHDPNRADALAEKHSLEFLQSDNILLLDLNTRAHSLVNTPGSKEAPASAFEVYGAVKGTTFR